MTISVAKGLLIILFFYARARQQPRHLACRGYRFFWPGYIMLVLAMSDYATPGWK